MTELEQTLQKILEKSIETAEQTGEFIVEQGTDLLQQFFMWHTIVHILGIFLSFLILVVGFLIPRLWGMSSEDLYHKKIMGRWYDMGGLSYAYLTIFSFGCFSAVLFCLHVYKLIFILIAPKLYLLEYFF